MWLEVVVLEPDEHGKHQKLENSYHNAQNCEKSAGKCEDKVYGRAGENGGCLCSLHNWRPGVVKRKRGGGHLTFGGRYK